MRISVSHDRTRDEARKIVDETFDQIFQPQFPIPIRVVAIQKNWVEWTLNYFVGVSLGSASAPIRGTAEVTDRDVIFNVELPGFLNQLLPESMLRELINTKVRGLLK